MEESMREKIALFRYGLIAPLINGQVDRATYLAEVSSKTHQVPLYGEKTYAVKTILEWWLFYRREGFDGLKPGTRSDRGKSRTLSEEQQARMRVLRRQHADMPVTVFYETMIAQGELMPSEVSYATLHRFFSQHGLVKGEADSAPEERKRFAHDTVNRLWQTDASEGPRLLIGGKLIRTHLLAFIDDCSRLVPFAQFVPTEKFDGLRTVMKEALIRRGIPKLLYTDNGKIFRSDILQFACANLGIQLLHTRSFDPQSKGKIERYFRTVKMRFYTLLKAQPATSLEELNTRFWAWLETEYHRRPHASLEGKMPLEVYLSQIEQVRTVSDPAMLDPLFLRRAKRTVKHDATFSLENRLYELPAAFAGQKIELRYDEQAVHVYGEGKAVVEAKAVKFADNAHVKRERPALSFKALQERAGEADV